MLDYNAISDALLDLLKTATWTNQAGITEGFGTNPVGCNASRKIISWDRDFPAPYLGLEHWATDVEQSQAFGIQVERMRFRTWIYLTPNSDLSLTPATIANIPDIYLTNCEVAVRNAINLRYPFVLKDTNNPALGYMPNPPGWVQTLGGLVGNEAGSNGAFIEGQVMRHALAEDPPLILMIPITVLAGNP